MSGTLCARRAAQRGAFRVDEPDTGAPQRATLVGTASPPRRLAASPPVDEILDVKTLEA
jgi:hypothetical protein